MSKQFTTEEIEKLRAVGVDRPDVNRIFVIRPIDRAGVRWDFKEGIPHVTGAMVGGASISETEARGLWAELLTANVWFNTKSREFEARIPAEGMIEKYIPNFLATVVESIRRELNQT